MSIMQLLKHETKQLHEEIQKMANAEALLNLQATLGDYKNLITFNFIVHALVEEQTKKYTQLKEFVSDFSKRTKIEVLKRDLKEMGLSSDQFVISSSFFAINSLSEALGALYVLEGTTLGGNVIVRHLLKNENMQSIKRYHFFGVYGQETSSLWRSFSESLENYVKTFGNVENNAIIAGAKNTFMLAKEVLLKG